MKKHDDRALLAGFATLFPGQEVTEYGAAPVRTMALRTPREALAALYAELPARLPPLYEELILSYRWPEVDLGRYRLLANPAGPGLAGLLAEMKRDPVLWQELVPRGWIPFGKGPDLNYDPVCFDLRRRRKNGDYRVALLDHEEILCFSRIREVEELAPSFHDLVIRTVAGARR